MPSEYPMHEREWQRAYDRALAKGLTDGDALYFADSVIEALPSVYFTEAEWIDILDNGIAEFKENDEHGG